MNDELHECPDLGTTRIYNVMAKDNRMYAEFRNAGIPVFMIRMGAEFEAHVTRLPIDAIDRAVKSLRRATDGLALWNEDRKVAEKETAEREEAAAEFEKRLDEADNERDDK